MSFRHRLLLSLLMLFVIVPAVQAQEPMRNYLRLEGGLSGVAYNTLQNPKNADGDRFSQLPLLGTKNKAFGRLIYERALDERHGIRFVYAPLRDSGTGIVSKDLRYRGKVFAAGVPIHATYQFDGYRATYWWDVRNDPRMRTRVGVTINIRDARTDLDQGSTSDHFWNVGAVPLLYLALDRPLTKRLTAYAEADAFIVRLGRAIDLNARLGYSLSSRTEFLLGVRTLEGGVDRKNDIYNFTRYNYVTAGIGIRF